MSRRYERELEAENEMKQSLSVFGIIKMFEDRIQKNKSSNNNTTTVFRKSK